MFESLEVIYSLSLVAARNHNNNSATAINFKEFKILII